MPLAKGAPLAEPEPSVFHLRTAKGDLEIDFLLEAPGRRVAGVEVKATKTIREHDFDQLEKARDLLGESFVRGVVLYLGDSVLPFGDRVAAWPVSALWS